jgi:hypothetical protein
MNSDIQGINIKLFKIYQRISVKEKTTFKVEKENKKIIGYTEERKKTPEKKHQKI